MADPLAEKLAEVLFGTTNVGEIHPKNYAYKICRVNMTSPGNLAEYRPGTMVRVTIETTCCEHAHEINLLDDTGATVTGCGCTPTITCDSGTSGSGSGYCDIRMPAATGYYTLEVVIGGATHQTGSTVNIKNPGLFGWLWKWFHNLFYGPQH